MNSNDNEGGDPKFLQGFRVNKQPGNNWRIAATCKQIEVNSLRVDDPTAPTYVPAGNSPVNAFDGKLTEMLTVWRHLNIEVDSMGAVPSPKPSPDRTVAKAKGNIKINTPVNGQSTITLDRRLPGPADFYGGGFIRATSNAPGVGTFTFDIVSNTDNFFFTDSIIINGVPAGAQIGALHQEFEIFDDDDRFLPVGFDPPLPNLGLVTAQVIDKFTPAYIEMRDVATLPGNLNPHKIVLFGPNLEGATVVSMNANHDLADSPAFWTLQVVAGYQGAVLEDYDPNTEEPVGGNTNGSVGRSVVHLESIRDIYKDRRGLPILSTELQLSIDIVTAHEIGHPPDGANGTVVHNEGGLMSSIGNPLANPVFTPKTIRRFRNAVQWRP